MSVVLQPKESAESLLGRSIKSPEHLDLFRMYLALVRTAGPVSHAYNISPSLTDKISNDFVTARKSGETLVTEDGLYKMLNLARYNVISRNQAELDEQAWEHAKYLESQRAQVAELSLSEGPVGM